MQPPNQKLILSTINIYKSTKRAARAVTLYIAPANTLCKRCTIIKGRINTGKRQLELHHMLQHFSDYSQKHCNFNTPNGCLICCTNALSNSSLYYIIQLVAIKQYLLEKIIWRDFLKMNLFLQGYVLYNAFEVLIQAGKDD
jgi:hypothetical protein